MTSDRWPRPRGLSLRYKFRMWRMRQQWRKREIASWPKSPTDAELVEYWTGPDSPAHKPLWLKDS